MEITDEFLVKHSACIEGRQWVEGQDTRDGTTLVERLITHNIDWANWLVVRMMTRRQRIAYAIFAAEQVIGIFETTCPNDNRPRIAIEAAKTVLMNDTEEARTVAVNAAYADAVRAAVNADAVNAAVNVVRAAAYADAVDAIFDTVNAAVNADAAAAVNTAILRKKIIRYGLELLRPGKCA